MGLTWIDDGKGIVDGFKEYFTFANLGDQTAIEAISSAVGEQDAEQLYGLLEDIPDTYRRSFCSRLVLPVLMATAESDDHINNLINNYQLNYYV